MNKCPHCVDGHGEPNRCSWNVFVGSQIDSDGQPLYLIVQPANGAHVAQEDADWLYELMKNWHPPFIDLCTICGHKINAIIDIVNKKQTVCALSRNKIEGYDSQNNHRICTYSGCVPDLEYRRDNLRIGQKLWQPSKNS
jgi:hypothetical protein